MIVNRVAAKCSGLMRAVRLWVLRWRGVTVGAGTQVYGKIHLIGDPRNLTIGSGCTLNLGVMIVCHEKVVLADRVRLSPYAKIITGALEMGQLEREHYYLPISIEANVWIATGAVISAGVTIGENSVIGANSVVTRDVASNTFCAGVPAKMVKQIVLNE